MTEEWVTLRDYPGYSASDLGRVRNDKRSRILALTSNQYHLSYVCLMRGGVQVKRSLSKLICEAFVPIPNQTVPFTTPIHLNGDPSNCQATNLLWRPRWFALKHSRQFKLDLPQHKSPIRVMETNEVYENIWPFVITYGLLYMDIILAIMRHTYVFPTKNTFEWAK